VGKKKRVFINLFIVTLLFFSSTRQAKAQESIEVTDVRVGHDFGEEIRFSARVEASNPIKEVLLIFRDVNEENTRVISLDPDSKTSKKYSIIYADNRFDWEMREDEMLRVYWNSGDEAFGLAALDVARSGLKEIQTLFPVPLDERIDIYIYASSVDLQNALFMGGETWIAGHASPALGIVFVAIAPGEQEQIFMQKKIPHELTHILLYRYIGENYNRLPTWLNEGLASIAEQYANPDYALALKRAVENKTLISIDELCEPFPRDASQAFLAYAESESFTRYLQNNYGTSGLDDLIIAYADGLSCEKGVEDALGRSLTYLDGNWQESVLGANPFGVAWRALSPYVVLFALLLATPLITGIFALKKRRQ
jgi:hypothetical protein